jgi:hypothetical protein
MLFNIYNVTYIKKKKNFAHFSIESLIMEWWETGSNRSATHAVEYLANSVTSATLLFPIFSFIFDVFIMIQLV